MPTYLGTLRCMVRCEFCHEELDPRAVGNYRRVVGWTQVRSQGGTNSITLPSEPMGYAHGTCIDIEKLRRSKGWQAEKLF